MRRSQLRVAMMVAVLSVLLGIKDVSAQSATFYDDIDFGGGSFNAGSDVSFVGWDWNDRISSISVPQGMSVTLYEHSDYGGQSLTLTSGTADLRWFNGPGPDGTWNDQASSIQISGGGGPPPGPTSLTFVINGIESTGDWALPGTDFSNAIAATYGAAPQLEQWTSNQWYEVLPPSYSGIISGAHNLAVFLNSLPPGDVNLIAHSHGGNVVMLSQIWSSRPIRRYITLATPVNWDWLEWRYALNYGVAGRCQASSTADWVQVWGASPYQVSNMVINAFQSVQGAYQAFQELLDGNYADAYVFFAQSVFNAIEADYWLDTTRIEVEGPTYVFGGLGHPELHTSGVWNALPAFCR